MNRAFFRQIGEMTVERALVVARYSGENGWVKDAIKAGNFAGYTVALDGTITILFSGSINGRIWSDTVLLDSRYMEMSIEEIENEFQQLATARDKHKKVLENQKRELEIAGYQEMYRELEERR